MSNNNGRPWYRDKVIIIPLVTAILATLATVTLTFVFSPSPSDFSITINPAQILVKQGSVVQSTATIRSINGYDNPISLTASGQPPGIIVTFIPAFVWEKESYISSIMINVGQNVPAGDYTIIIKGVGSDGKEHSLIYDLSVESTTSTRTLTVTPISLPLEIKIISPKDGDEVPVSALINGTISRELPEGQFMWLIISPYTSPGLWWPQEGRINPWKNKWNVRSYFGLEKKDVGMKFDVAVILVNEKDDQYYLNYLQTGQETGNYPGIPLPTSAKIIDKITVIRK